VQEIKPSEIKIGDTVEINMGGKSTTHIIRGRIDKAYLRKHKCSKWAKEETPEEYQEYKRIIKLYASKGFLIK